jgi:hypothetical protein
MEYNITEKQMKVGEILAMAWEMLKEHNQTLLGVFLIFSLPLSILAAFFVPAELSTYGQLTGQFSNSTYELISFLLFLLAMLSMTAAVISTQHLLQGKKMTIAEAIRMSLSRWPWVILIALVYTLLVGILSIFLLIPGIIFGVYCSFAVTATAAGDSMNLTHSKKIVRGRWWTVFGYNIVFALAMIALYIPVGIIVAIIPTAFASEVANQVFSSMITAFYTVISAIFYFNFKATTKDTSSTAPLITPPQTPTAPEVVEQI